MAGEQDKEQDKDLKPKAKLIKHRKDEQVSEQAESSEPSGSSHIKVVKKKVVVKIRNHADGRDGSEASASSRQDQSTRPAVPQSSPDHSSGASTSPQSRGQDAGLADSDKPRNYSSKQGVVGGRYVGPPPRREVQDRRPAPHGDAPAWENRGERFNRPEQGQDRPYRQGGDFGDRPSYGDRPQGDRPSYNERPQGDRPNFNDRPQGDRPAYNDRPQGDRPGYNDRPQGDRPPYGDRQGGNYNRYDQSGSEGYRGPRPEGDFNRGPGGPGGPGGYNRGPGGPGGPGGYNRGPGGPGGPGGYNRGPGGPGGQGGYNRGPGGPRPPFGSKPGGGSAPAAPLPGSERSPSAKKFVKAKKGTYTKKDKLQEKELQFNKKKSAIKVNPVPKSIDIMEVITVAELARKMNLKASDLIAKLFGMGMMVTINQQIDAETATILANEYQCEVKIVSLYDETLIESDGGNVDDVMHRPPVVTIMGHVDHGKTKLLDAIRSTDVVAGEAGGITQHIGAYQVTTPNGKITFIDTPGHEAFTAMRARGALVTDIVILVVAANDGVMPQTVEAIRHAQEGKVPIIVAMNKVDLPDANIDRVKQQLAEYGLLAEDWGGTNMYFPISALKKLGLQELLDGVLLQAEILELSADAKCRAEGHVLESKIDQGRGIVSTVLIQRGQLKVGDSFVAGVFPGKVRAMFNDRGERIEIADPSTPVEILGFTGVPDAGDPFQVTESDKDAREIGEKRQELKKMEGARNVKRITLDNLYDSIQDGDNKELNVIIKGDVHGSVEAIQTSLEKLSTREIKLSVKLAAAGAINESDVLLAAASSAIIIGFHVRPSAKAQLMADQEKVEIRKYSIIYDVIEDIKSAMEGMLTPELKEEQTATVEVREVFRVPKLGAIAGAYVLKGSAKRSASAHIVRDGIEIFTGKIASLRRFKDDVKQVETGFECGVGIEGFADYQVGDILEIFEVKEVAKKLGKTLIEEQEEQKKLNKEQA